MLWTSRNFVNVLELQIQLNNFVTFNPLKTRKLPGQQKGRTSTFRSPKPYFHELPFPYICHSLKDGTHPKENNLNMAKFCISPPSQCLALAIMLAILMSSNTLEALKPKISNIQFYMHDIVGGPNATAMLVAPSEPLNISGTNPVAAMFGSTYVIDDPLTATPDPKSTLLGRAQGIYAMSSLGDEFSLHMTLTYSFVSGPYKNSSISVIGRNMVMRDVREFPIVGGTGIFRLARGYCLAYTHSTLGFDAVVRYNVTVLHY